MDDKRVLHGMIEIYENDFMCGYEGEDKQALQLLFLELIVAVTRYVNDYRYCSKKDCSCSPEAHIKAFTKKYEKEIYEKLLGGAYGLSEVPLSKMREFLKQF